MRKTIFRPAGRCGFVSLGLVAIFLGALTSAAAGGAFTRGCAARDFQLLTMIEEQESAGLASAEQLSEALIEIMNARIVCHYGRVLDALAIYDSIAESVRPVSAGRDYTTGIR